MVNVGRGNSTSQGNFYPPRDYWSRGNRPYVQPSQAPRSPYGHQYTQDIISALRECARIPVKEFALLVKSENGEEMIYSSPSLRPHQSMILNGNVRREFHRCCAMISPEAPCASPGFGSGDGVFSDAGFPTGHDFRKYSSGGDSLSEYGREYRPRQPKSEASSDGMGGRRRKRTRYHSEDDPGTPIVQKYQNLKIGDEEEVKKFYETRFKDLQQSACKVMGKAFVKLVEPKKQTHHPYTGKNERAPNWWPSMTGPDAVRHIEPDHLLKPERVLLLVHILRIIVEPTDKQHVDIAHLGLNVRKLEEVTNEMMSPWFNDKDHPDNAAKRVYLKEIFKVARADERYRNGEIDGSTAIPVMYGDRIAGQDSDDEEGDPLVEEDESAQMSSSIHTPDSLISPTTIPAPHHSQFDPESQSMAHQQNRAVINRHMSAGQIEDQSGYIDGLRVGGYHTQSPNLREFRGPYAPGFQNPQAMYANGWPNPGVMSNPPITAPNYCMTSSPPSLAPPTTAFQLPAPHGPLPQHMLPPPPYADGLPSSAIFDSRPILGPNNQLRTGSLGHPHQLSTPHTFTEYLQDGGGYGQNDPDMKEEQNRQP